MDSNGKLTRPADCLLSLELMADTIEASKQPFPDALNRVAAVNNRIKLVVGSGNPLDKWNYMITALMMPAVGSGFEATATGLARQRAVQAAIAAERYRQANGAFPKRLSDLVPGYLAAVPSDPFDGQPLRSMERPGELVIYSVSRNKIDDGGVEKQQPAPYPADIVVRVRAVNGTEADRQENEGQENNAGESRTADAER
jgi:hypothetical protein